MTEVTFNILGDEITIWEDDYLFVKDAIGNSYRSLEQIMEDIKILESSDDYYGILTEEHEWICDPEHEKAYDDWLNNLDFTDQPSYFTEWNISKGIIEDYCYKGYERRMFTPEMLMCRFQLNWNFNFVWNTPKTRMHCEGDEELRVPKKITTVVKVVEINSYYGVGIFNLGSVYISKNLITMLYDKLNESPLNCLFEAELSFTNGILQIENPKKSFEWSVNHKDFKKLCIH